MAYTPDPYDNTQPVSSVVASTLPAELRALKTALLERRAATEQNADDIQLNADDITALQAALAAGTRFAFLTDTTQESFVVPAGVNELFIIAISGGQGGQGGGQRMRFRATTTAGLNGSYSSYYGLDSERANDGKPGIVYAGYLPVTPGETYDYICGAGSAGGAAHASPNQSHTCSAITPYLSEPGNDRDTDWQWLGFTSAAAALSLRGVTMDANGVPISKSFDAVVNGKAQVRGRAGGNYRTDDNWPYAAFKTNVTLSYGDVAAAGGDTRFGIPANPNDPALLEIQGGGAQPLQTVGTTEGLFGTTYGRGGRGGLNANAIQASPSAGTTGGDGAILVMW